MQVINGFGGGMIPNNFCVERFADLFLEARFLVARFLVVRFLVGIFSPLNRDSGTAEIDSVKIPKRNRQVNKIRVEGGNPRALTARACAVSQSGTGTPSRVVDEPAL